MSKKLSPNEVSEKMGLPLHDVIYLLETHAIPASAKDEKWEIDAEIVDGIITIAVLFLQKASKDIKGEAQS